MSRLFIFFLIAILLSAPVKADGVLPLFDTHVHYSQPAWRFFKTQEIFEIFKKAGVVKALVSSSPDDGTVMLHDQRPEVVVPMLRPYRPGADPSNWFNAPDSMSYLRGRLAKGIYKGVGEFHLYDWRSAQSRQVRELAKLAVEQKFILQVHSDAKAISLLFEQSPKLKILWAHAGLSEPAETVGRMLDTHKQLWAGVSFRADSIAPNGTIDAVWRQVILRHTDRFMFGTDTYVNERWVDYQLIVDEHRNWIRQLPRPVAEAIAFRNAARLFGGGKSFPE